MIGCETFLTFNEKQKRTPKNHGYWDGKRGDSRFYSDDPKMKEMGAEYIEYVNGEPDFSPVSVCKFEIPSMTNDRLPYSTYYKSNYEQAYSVLSQKFNITESEVKKWLKDNHYTLHEAFDQKTIYVVPVEIHKKYIHAGGVAEVNSILNDEEEDAIIESVLNNNTDSELYSL